MVARLRVTPVPEAPESRLPESAPASAPSAPPLIGPAYAYLARLASLHDEAAETAHLANLLGRAPWIAGFLGTASIAVALVAPWTVALAVWLGLMAIGLAAIGHNYTKAIAAPFDRNALRTFARSFSACLIYAGAAWGAGLFLALPASLAGAIAFPALAAAVLAFVLKARDLAFSFLVPATLMGAFCVLMQNGNTAAASGIVAAGLVVAGITLLFERLSQATPRPQAG
jgi:hypothetical protein